MARYFFEAYKVDGTFDVIESDDYEELKEFYAAEIIDLHLGTSSYVNVSFMQDRGV